MRFYIFFGLLFFIATLYSCGTKKDAVETNQSKTIEQDKTKVAPNEIVFLYFKISKGIKNSPSKLNIVKKLAKEGNIKLPGSIINLKNYLTVEVYQSGKLAYSFMRKHPIYKTLEFLNEKHIPQSKYVALDEQNFVIRLQKKGGVSNEVTIYETIEGGTKTKLKTIQF